jgi:predicted DsbA family dithiol-disulfide isomerase
VLVEIYADVVCPWSAIGKRHFEAALASFSGRDRVEVVWRPFRLGPEAVVAVTSAGAGEIARAATGVGLECRPDRVVPADTFDAHRLVHLAAGTPVVHQLVERLFRAHLVEGRDVGDAEVLVAVAEEAGMDPHVARAALGADTGAAAVAEALDAGRARGVRTVPTFVFEGRWAVSGAQDPGILLEVLERIAAMSASGAAEP